MESFAEKVIKAMGERPDADTLGTHLAEAFDLGLKTADEIRPRIIKATEPLFNEGKAIEASMALFVCVMALVKWAESGVQHSAEREMEQTEGKSEGPVKAMWDLIEVALRAESSEEAVAAMKKIGEIE